MANIRDIKLSLFSECGWIGLLSGRGKPYDHIIKDLIKIGEYWNSDDYDYSKEPITIKWIAERVNETPAHINKWMRAIYTDILALNSQEPELFAKEGEILCEFWLTDYLNERSCIISFGFAALPHVGDTIDLMFVRAAVGQECFHVIEIKHIRYDGKTKIMIVCKPGYFYNKYRELLLDKARFMNEIGYMTERNAHTYLDDMLRHYEKKGYIPEVETIIKEREERLKYWREHNKKK